MKEADETFQKLTQQINGLKELRRESENLWNSIANCENCRKFSPLKKLAIRLAVNEDKIRTILCPKHRRKFDEYNRKYNPHPE